MTNEQVMNSYIQELVNIRAQLEFTILQLKAEINELKQPGADQSSSTIGSPEVHNTNPSD